MAKPELTQQEMSAFYEAGETFMLQYTTFLAKMQHLCNKYFTPKHFEVFF